MLYFVVVIVLNPHVTLIRTGPIHNVSRHIRKYKKNKLAEIFSRIVTNFGGSSGTLEHILRVKKDVEHCD